MVRKYFAVVLKLLLALMFIVSAVAKLSEVQNFADSLNSYKILSKSLVPFFSYYVPVMELGLAIGFLLPRFDRAVAILTTLVIVVFQVALASLIYRGIDVDCACFGSLATTPKVALVRNFVILAMCSLLLFSYHKNAKLQNCNTV